LTKLSSCEKIGQCIFVIRNSDIERGYNDQYHGIIFAESVLMSNALKKILNSGSKVDRSKVTLAFEQTPGIDMYHVTAFYDDQKIGQASFLGQGKKHLVPSQVDVDKDFRGNGIATSMYIFAQNKTKRTVIPSKSRSTDSLKMWKRFKSC